MLVVAVNHQSLDRDESSPLQDIAGTTSEDTVTHNTDNIMECKKQS